MVVASNLLLSRLSSADDTLNKVLLLLACAFKPKIIFDEIPSLASRIPLYSESSFISKF
uniref:Uncharacterized protein n=1 Tax=Arundo donax TaxID=35708 RepID=A0A0A9BMT3_ARUDO